MKPDPLPVVDFLAQLPEPERRKLQNAMEAGLSDVRMVDRCLHHPRPKFETTRQLYRFLAHAIDQLERARDVVRRLA